MDKEFESIIKSVKHIKLKENEKILMRANLLKIINLQNVQQMQNIINPKTNRLYGYYQNIKDYYFMINKNKFVPVFIVALIIVLTGGTAVFAEKTIPGDLLYKVKTSVNEPVAGVFALTKEDKTEWQERLIERRLEEAQKLISKGDLSETARVDLEGQIKSKIDEFNVNVNELALEKNEDINSSDLNIRLQASLGAYQNVIQKLSGEANIDTDTKKETEKFLANLDEYKNKVKDDHKNLELNVGVNSQNVTAVSGVSTNSSVLDKQTAAVNLLTSTKLTYQKEKIDLSTNIQNQIDNKLALAETALEEGKSAMASSDYENATIKFQIVIGSANEAKLLMLSNVIKGDIEDDMGIEGDSGDIEDDNRSGDIEDDKNLNDSESIKVLHSDRLKFEEEED